MSLTHTGALNAPEFERAAPLRGRKKAASEDSGKVFAGRILFAVAILVIWEVSARWLLNPFWIGQPSTVAVRLWEMAVSGDL
ncbi:MAG TPA: hypothetical protein VGC69_05360, partial [Bordetella sp.]